MNRHYGVELLRCFLMLGICAIHIAGRMGGVWVYVSKALLPCVVAFVFISGYYGIGFSARKILRFCVLGIWCAGLAAMGTKYVFLAPENRVDIYQLAFENYKYFWFLHSYVFLMFFAPIVNAALTRENALRLGAPILFLVFGWSFAYSFSVMRKYVVGLEGFGEMSGLTMLGIYVFARMVRLLDWERYVSGRVALVILICTLPFTAVRFGAYDSPVALIVGMALFELGSRMQVRNDGVVRAIKLLTPSLFAIYLLHVNSFGWRGMAWLVRTLRDGALPEPAVFLMGTIIVFVACFVVDLIRRGLLSGMACSIRFRSDILRCGK